MGLDASTRHQDSFCSSHLSWRNEARGKAAVHCVIVGFGSQDVPNKIIYEYDNIRGEPHAVKVKNINPYLVDTPDIVLPRLSKPICPMPLISKGNQPADGGHLILSPEEKESFLAKNPQAAFLIKRLIGVREFLQGQMRYFLWLVDVPPNIIRSYPFVMDRIEKCSKI